MAWTLQMWLNEARSWRSLVKGDAVCLLCWCSACSEPLWFMEETGLCGGSAGPFIIWTDLINPMYSEPKCTKHYMHPILELETCCLVDTAYRELLCLQTPAASAGRDQQLMGLGQWELSHCCWEDKVRRSAAANWVSTLQPLWPVVGKQGLLCELQGVRATGRC